MWDVWARRLRLALVPVPALAAFVLGDGPVAWVLGVIVTARLVMLHRCGTRLLRYVRTGVFFVRSGVLVVVATVAATPVGGWILSGWEGSPTFHGLAGGLLLATPTAWTLLLVGIASTVRADSISPWVGRGLWATTMLADLLRGVGVFGFAGAALALSHPASRGVLVAAVVVAGAELVSTVIRTDLSNRNMPQQTQMQAFGGTAPAGVEFHLRAWLYDTFDRRPGKPDYSVLYALVEGAAMGWPGGQQPLARKRLGIPQPSFSFDVARRFVAGVDEAVDLDGHAAHTQKFAAALVALAGARIAHSHAQLDEAVLRYQFAAEEFERIGMRDHAAYAATNRALVVLLVA